jgi:hypothetical protein
MLLTNLCLLLANLLLEPVPVLLDVERHPPQLPAGHISVLGLGEERLPRHARLRLCGFAGRWVDRSLLPEASLFRGATAAIHTVEDEALVEIDDENN